MSDVASSFTILGFQGFPQNSLHQRAAVSLFSCIGSPPYIVIRERHSQPRSYARGTFANISGPPDFRVGLEHSHEDDLLNVVSYSVIGWLAGQSLYDDSNTQERIRRFQPFARDDGMVQAGPEPASETV